MKSDDVKALNFTLNTAAALLCLKHCYHKINICSLFSLINSNFKNMIVTFGHAEASPLLKPEEAASVLNVCSRFV